MGRGKKVVLRPTMLLPRIDELDVYVGEAPRSRRSTDRGISSDSLLLYSSSKRDMLQRTDSVLPSAFAEIILRMNGEI